MKKHLLDWVPCSAFSKFSLGTLTGIVLDLLFPGTAILWIGIVLITFSLSGFFEKRFQISEYFFFGIFFLLAATSFYPERFQPSHFPKNTFLPVPKKNLFGEPEKIFQERFRERVLFDLKQAALEKKAQRIALGLLFGEAKQLSKDFKEKAKEGGILHLFAASGLHLGILMGVQFRLLNLIPSFGHRLPRILPLLTGFLYLSALGYPVSLTRAWIFAGMLLLQGLFYRKLRPIDLLLGSAWIVWIADPFRFYSVSFSLSFGAVTGIFLFSNPIRILFRFLSDENRISSFFKENLSISFSAGLGTMPVLLSAFGSFSFGSILLNLLVVPLAGILLPILYLSICVQETAVPLLNEPLWSITEFLIFILAYLSERLSEPLGFYREMGDAAAIGMSGWVLLCIGVFAFAWLPEKLRLKTDANNNIRNSEFSFRSRLSKESFSKKRFLSPKRIDSILCGSFILFTIALHVLLYRSSDLFPNETKLIYNRFFLILRSGDSLFFSGKCKYGFKTISKAFQKTKKNFCESQKDSPLNRVFVEDESCLIWAFSCLKNLSKTPILYAGQNPEPWIAASRFPLQRSEPIREISLRNESKIVFFHTKKDSLFALSQKTKTGRGWILLETPFGSKDKAEVWNQNRKLLGLSESWVFLEKDELQRIPISESF
ncbi:ComEC/Rec2 family competence protein [Leptospira sp. FAT2]|uniref:ComEC/Rec2 family competence protein n=1 Tax=Leptospira sanjuanensis TaxID=2879643 RepID=UPI001EE8A68A|nr:ComEC/Rec2 family competence protein [Leptospira sanjuanensis]MCG6192072.1 ComEC/Rec2 family competence protein [Leptospira sanjuanensis]